MVLSEVGSRPLKRGAIGSMKSGGPSVGAAVGMVASAGVTVALLVLLRRCIRPATRTITACLTDGAAASLPLAVIFHSIYALGVTLIVDGGALNAALLAVAGSLRSSVFAGWPVPMMRVRVLV